MNDFVIFRSAMWILRDDDAAQNSSVMKWSQYSTRNTTRSQVHENWNKVTHDKYNIRYESLVDSVQNFDERKDKENYTLALYGLLQNWHETTYNKILTRLGEFDRTVATEIIKRELNGILPEDSDVITNSLESAKTRMEDIFKRINDTITNYKTKYLQSYENQNETTKPIFRGELESTMFLDYVSNVDVNEIIMLCYLVFDDIRVQAFQSFSAIVRGLLMSGADSCNSCFPSVSRVHQRLLPKAKQLSAPTKRGLFAR